MFEEFYPPIMGEGLGGIFFSPEEEVAALFAQDAFDRDESEDTAVETVVAVYLAIQNPKIVEADAIMSDGIHSLYAEFDAIAKARAEGFDGMLIRNVPEHSDRCTDQWVAFSSEQIKSVDNVGTFDLADPRIMFKRFPAAVVDQAEREDQCTPRF
ncbi:ADP-ribosyltransferase-containing protein [Pseudoxanthomonas kaohsiungensis]|uniref:ART-PolyVal-like domain-containing protein n=1 Tax=Pseudoxanthomonas kaohsiungensis TaxID=283923 RepID=A0ABW3LYU6_9GAMM|nr:hypothetical protein [Pseudoxanthomonas kaohsiungensis]KAF1702901.1 hypothetical protein CSC66_09000 [Pseudoxanthomonas kaohsiungensis]